MAARAAWSGYACGWCASYASCAGSQHVRAVGRPRIARPEQRLQARELHIDGQRTARKAVRKTCDGGAEAMKIPLMPMMHTQTERLAPMESEELEAGGREAMPSTREHADPHHRSALVKGRRVLWATTLAALCAGFGLGLVAATTMLSRSRVRGRRIREENTGNWTLVLSLPFSGIVVNPSSRRVRSGRHGRPRPAFPIFTASRSRR